MSEWVWYGALIAFGASWVVALLVSPLIERFGGERAEFTSLLAVMVLFWGSLATGATYIGYGVLTADWSEDAVEPASAGAGRNGCHPSHKDACLSSRASDYDCTGGSGDGPRYTSAVRVVGFDEYDLDRDGDGWGCE